MAEMLAVLAIMGITIAIGIPLVNEQVRIADIRAAADNLAVNLRAARMIAVSHHKNITVTVNNETAAAPNTVTYLGTTNTLRTVTMPKQVNIKSSSAASITFLSDGSATAASTITTESLVTHATERWTLSVNTAGMVSVVHVRV